MEMSEGMKAFAKKYNRSLKDPKLRGLYELDLSARRDQAAIAYTAEMKGHANGLVKGRVEGRIEGRAEERAKMIGSMLDDDVPVSSIYKYVDAPRAEIDAIIARLRAAPRA